MKAVPIAQYLDQKSRAATAEVSLARGDASPLAPKLAPPANDSKPQGAAVFRRLPRAAPLVAQSRDEEEPPAPRRAEPDAPRREASVFRTCGAPPPPRDLEGELAEAYHRGVQEGLDAATAEAANARAQERAELQKRAVVERLDFQMNEYARLAEQIANGLIEVEGRIAEVVARLLQHFVAQAVSKQVVDELVRAIERLRGGGRPGLINIRGPERLLSALKARLADLAIDVEYAVEEGIEVTVEASPTSIRSQIAPWAELLASLAEPE